MSAFALKGSFGAVSGPKPHTLILGTQPSDDSLNAGRYYNMNTNCLWYIVGDALGWQRAPGPEAVIAYDLLGQTLGLFGLEELAKDIGVPVETLGHGGLTLAHNLRSRAEVEDLLVNNVVQGRRQEASGAFKFKVKGASGEDEFAHRAEPVDDLEIALAEAELEGKKS